MLSGRSSGRPCVGRRSRGRAGGPFYAAAWLQVLAAGGPGACCSGRLGRGPGTCSGGGTGPGSTGTAAGRIVGRLGGTAVGSGAAITGYIVVVAGLAGVAGKACSTIRRAVVSRVESVVEAVVVSGSVGIAPSGSEEWVIPIVGIHPGIVVVE